MYDKELRVQTKLCSYPIELSVEMRDFSGRPDCKVGHFGHNFWFRTPYGVRGKTYKNARTMERAIERCARNHGLEVLGWV